VVCPGKTIKTAAHVLPTAVVNAAGQGIRTSSVVVDGAAKPKNVCKTP
jgi:hypothetical protein